MASIYKAQFGEDTGYDWFYYLANNPLQVMYHLMENSPFKVKVHAPQILETDHDPKDPELHAPDITHIDTSCTLCDNPECTQGGGHRGRSISESGTIAIDNTHITYESHPDNMKPAKFQIEDGPVWDGFTNGDLWNGWACPAFTKEVAQQIMDHYSEQGQLWWWEDDTLCCDSQWTDHKTVEDLKASNCAEDIERWEPQENCLYWVGAYCWIWDTVEDE